MIPDFAPLRVPFFSKLYTVFNNYYIVIQRKKGYVSAFITGSTERDKYLSVRLCVSSYCGKALIAVRLGSNGTMKEA
ncbi:hypothetical protein HMPREF1870_01953 [Bacteroidales bacterium KA00344]|nr:hypothetical protein HMPREF1870_01953 [Bacteroidales bacterium KA00344]